MPRLDLTPFGFTPTEGLVYQVLLTAGPGTGYAVAREAGLARANAYAALEGLVAKGAARADEGRPRRYRPEPPASLLARIASDHGRAVEQLAEELEGLSAPSTPALVEIDSARAALQLVSHDVARATERIHLLAPADAFPLLAPALRRPVAAGLEVILASSAPLDFAVAPVRVARPFPAWPGEPLVMAVDGRSGMLATRQGAEVQGHWGTAAAFVAAARALVEGSLA